jgi:hypothetical protein
MALLSTEGDVCPSGYVVDGMFGDAIEATPVDPVAGCRCRQHLGMGDVCAPPLDP